MTITPSRNIILLHKSGMMTLPAPSINPRQEIVSLLRGYVACPLLSCLSENGMLGRMGEGAFQVEDVFPGNPTAARAVLHYLSSLGLISPVSGDLGRFTATRLGKSVFRRSGAFNLLHSYRDYFENLAGVLESDEKKSEVNRELNIRGSGSLHGKKFFPAALQMLDGPIGRIIDVGCGDGEFLEAVLNKYPNVSLTGVDLSAKAVSTTIARFPAHPVDGIVSDGAHVAQWAAKATNNGGRTVISAWFVLHEFAEEQAEPVIRFFDNLHACFPTAEVIVGEIVKASPDVLARNYSNSVMPEFLFFHAISGQGVLSWEQHKHVLASIPYRLLADRHFDSLDSGKNTYIPSSFIWHLAPMGNL